MSDGWGRGDSSLITGRKEDFMLRVAVIGIGGIGRTHARCYKSDPLAEFVAVCDMIKEKADAAAAEFGVKAYYSVKDLLASEHLDSVSVTTSGVENGSH